MVFNAVFQRAVLESAAPLCDEQQIETAVLSVWCAETEKVQALCVHKH